MKNLSKLLALIVVLCMVLSVGAFASGEPSGEASGEASGEVKTAEEAFVDYIHEWLLAELEVNSNMTIEQIEDEFMPLIEAGDYVSFPAEMLWNGMLNNGTPMTFEEFAAQYVPEAASGEASGEGYTADEAGYKAYLMDWVAANPAVQANIDEFNAAIEAGAYAEFPLEMCFTDQWFGFAALTLDEFVAAGGIAEIPAFDPNLAPD